MLHQGQVPLAVLLRRQVQELLLKVQQADGRLEHPPQPGLHLALPPASRVTVNTSGEDGACCSWEIPLGTDDNSSGMHWPDFLPCAITLPEQL